MIMTYCVTQLATQLHGNWMLQQHFERELPKLLDMESLWTLNMICDNQRYVKIRRLFACATFVDYTTFFSDWFATRINARISASSADVIANLQSYIHPSTSRKRVHFKVPKSKEFLHWDRNASTMRKPPKRRIRTRTREWLQRTSGTCITEISYGKNALRNLEKPHRSERKMIQFSMEGTQPLVGEIYVARENMQSSVLLYKLV